MDGCAETSASKAIILSGDAARKVLSVFPLARFSETVVTALGENKDERFVHNLEALFQLQKMRLLYGALLTQVPNLNLAFPLFFEDIGEDNGWERRRIFWIGDHDPCDLGDSITIHATTSWEEQKRSNQLSRFEVSWESPAGATGCRCNWPQLHERIAIFLRVISPQLFNQIFKDFFDTIRPLVPCRETDNDHRHPKNCARCGGRLEHYVNERWTKESRPSCWLEMILGIDNWDKP